MSLTPEQHQVLVGALTALGTGVTTAVVNSARMRRLVRRAVRLAKRALAGMEALAARLEEVWAEVQSLREEVAQLRASLSPRAPRVARAKEPKS